MGIFRSYDIRGIYPNDIDVAFARRLGLALGEHFRTLERNRGKERLHFVVGRDMRASADACAPALIEGLCAAGHDVTDIGMVTTPCTYFAVQHFDADAGVIVTASHNPSQYIGFKVCRERAFPMGYDAGLNVVESLIDSAAPAATPGTSRFIDIDDVYIDFLVALAGPLKPLRVVVDAANGMAGKYLERLFAKFPCDFEGMFLEPDGTFPNHEADPSKPENLAAVAARVRARGAVAGFSLDGDGDRLGAVDENGDPVRGDLLAALLCSQILAETPGRPICFDLRSSKVLEDVIAANGGTPVRSRVGHSHIKKQMAEIESPFGSELSGHFYFQLDDRSRYYADSGLVALVRMLRALSECDEPLSERIAPLSRYAHTGEINFRVEDQVGSIDAIRTGFPDGRQTELDGVSVAFADWWFNVRSSNTEALLRLTLEGDTPALRDAGLARVKAVIERFGEETV
jgi:phosphomannomutase